MYGQGSGGRTSEWIEHRRDEDDELVGFLVPDGQGFVPVTVFGYPVAPSASREVAEEGLDRHGLSYLAERWTLQLEYQDPIRVEIVEASPRPPSAMVASCRAWPIAHLRQDARGLVRV